MKRRAFICGGMAAILASRRAPAFCIALRNGMMRPSAAPTPPPPYDAEVEYLESTGTQYIDTGIKCASEVGFMLDFISFDVADFDALSYPIFAGAQLTDWSYWLTVYASGENDVFREVSVGSESDNVTGYAYVRSVAKCNYLGDGKASFKNSGDQSATEIQLSSVDINSNIMLFAGGIEVDPGYSDMSKARVFAFGLSVGQNVVMDLIPVRFTNEQGVSEGAMYDRVSGQLFRNAGTGAFTIGPDKS